MSFYLGFCYFFETLFSGHKRLQKKTTKRRTLGSIPREEEEEEEERCF